MNDYTYKVLEILKVVDGDTVHLRIDLGFGVHIDERFRLEGVDTPEIVGADRATAITARDWLEKRLREVLPTLWVQSTKLDSFRRWLGTLWTVTDNVPENINAQMVSLGLAVPYKRSAPGL
jgi:micrococcal nuclease